MMITETAACLRQNIQKVIEMPEDKAEIQAVKAAWQRLERTPPQ